jgi:hypothetical protein
VIIDRLALADIGHYELVLGRGEDGIDGMSLPAIRNEQRVLNCMDKLRAYVLGVNQSLTTEASKGLSAAPKRHGPIKCKCFSYQVSLSV